jgi:hypothetical protein
MMKWWVPASAPIGTVTVTEKEPLSSAVKLPMFCGTEWKVTEIRAPGRKPAPSRRTDDPGCTVWTAGTDDGAGGEAGGAGATVVGVVGVRAGRVVGWLVCGLLVGVVRGGPEGLMTVGVVTGVGTVVVVVVGVDVGGVVGGRPRRYVDDTAWPFDAIPPKRTT